MGRAERPQSTKERVELEGRSKRTTEALEQKSARPVTGCTDSTPLAYQFGDAGKTHSGEDEEEEEEEGEKTEDEEDEQEDVTGVKTEGFKEIAGDD